MRSENPTIEPAEGAGLERAVTLTDAVVAIAMTLLILPLVEVAREVDTAHVQSFAREHWDLLLSFAVSFLVIYVFWAAHGAAYGRVARADVDVPALRRLNMWWLLVIAFLPFPTAVVGRDLNTTTAPIYIGTMLVLSTLTSAMTVIAAGASGAPGRSAWAWATTAVFAICTLVSLKSADLGMFLLLLLVVVRIVEVRIVHPASRTGSPSVEQTPNQDESTDRSAVA